MPRPVDLFLLEQGASRMRFSKARRQPCVISVVSQPPDEYPQEMCLLFTSPEHVKASGENFVYMFPPDDEIAQDIAVLLTVFLRRFVTVYTEVRRTRRKANSQEVLDERLPIVGASTRTAWKRKPLGIVWAGGKAQSVIDDNPRPLGIDPVRLSSQLRSVGRIRHGDTFLRAARLYWQALRMIEEWPDISYQLLVYCVETVANKAFAQFSPSRAEMVESKKTVADLAIKYGLTAQQSEELAVTACAGMTWASRKFRMFLSSAKDKIDQNDDDLFRLPSTFAPAAANFDRAIRKIYETRSQVVHRGKSHGASVGMGTAPMVPVPAVLEILSGTQEIPPVTWFERLVNAALCHYVDAENAFHGKIRERAYQIFEERGREHGHDLDDWLKAEKELGSSL